MRPQIRNAIEARGIQQQPYFQLASSSTTKNNESKWTVDKFVKTLRANGTLVINQYATRKSVMGEKIPPPPHIKLKIKIETRSVSVPGHPVAYNIQINASVPIDQIKELDGSIRWKNVLEWTNLKWNEKFGVLIKECKKDAKYAWIGDMSELFTEKVTSSYEHFGNTYINKNQERRKILHVVEGTVESEGTDGDRTTIHTVSPSQEWDRSHRLPILSTTTMVLPMRRQSMFVLQYKRVDERQINYAQTPSDIVKEQIIDRKQFHTLQPTLQRRVLPGNVEFMEMRVATPVFVSWQNVEKLRTIAKVICTRKGVRGFEYEWYNEFRSYVKSLGRPIKEERRRIHLLYKSATDVFRNSTDFIVKIGQKVRFKRSEYGGFVWKTATKDILSPDHHKKILMELTVAYASLTRNKLNDYDLREAIVKLIYRYFRYDGNINNNMLNDMKDRVIVVGASDRSLFKESARDRRHRWYLSQVVAIK